MGLLAVSKQRRRSTPAPAPIHWGFWGAGAVAQVVARDLLRVSGAELYAVGSPRIENAALLARTFSAKNCYGSLEELVGNPAIDVVYISTPNHSHTDDCLTCIHAGKAVLCEKPFALNRRQAELVITAARDARVFCMEAMWTRFIPAVLEAKRRVDAGVVGSVRLITGDFAYPTPRDNRHARLFDLESGGGALLDRGVYLISLAQLLLGTPEAVTGSAIISPSGVDVQSSWQLRFPGDAVANLTASFQCRGRNEVLICGDRGSLCIREPFYRASRLDTRMFSEGGASHPEGQKPALLNSIMPAMQLLRQFADPVVRCLRILNESGFLFAGNGYQFELQEVSNCIREQRVESDLMPLHDTLECAGIMDQLRYQWNLIYHHDQVSEAHEK